MTQANRKWNPADEVEEFNEPDEDDITTPDHSAFYQYGKLWLRVHPDASSEQMNAAIKAQMNDDQFWPNVWFISDHGNAHLMSIA